VLGLCALLAGSGVLHFAVPAPYRSIVPLPLRSRAAAVVALSGACELLCAALLLGRRTRRLGALATAALFVAVYPANIQMALDSGFPRLPFSVNRSTIAWLRLPLQLPLILWALRLRGSGAGR
ncbi:MAG TPA: DoxX family protein, partial [Chloroflexota bacterium]|nr:DoxX family protein [Chloroflexota bacterium]